MKIKTLIIVIVASVCLVGVNRVMHWRQSNEEQAQLDKEVSEMPPTWKTGPGKDYRQEAINDAETWLEFSRKSLRNNEEILGWKEQELSKATHPGRIAVLTEEYKSAKVDRDKAAQSVREHEAKVAEARRGK